MSKSKKKKETKAVIAGQIAFWVSFLGIISLPIPGFWRFVGGFAIASGLKKLIETMATPLDGLHTENGERVKEEPVIQVGTPEDQRAKEVVAGGLDLLSQIAAEREQIDEFVMTRRLKDLDELVRKMLQTVVDDPNEASRMRKFMSYYLPTTLKLLQSYRTMKTRGVSYSEMNTTREKNSSMGKRWEGYKWQASSNWTSGDIRSPSATATDPTAKKSARQRPSKSRPVSPSAASGSMSPTPPRSWSAASRPATPRTAR